MSRVDADLIPGSFEDLRPDWLAAIVGERVSGRLRLTEIASTSFSHVVELTDDRRSWIVKWCCMPCGSGTPI